MLVCLDPGHGGTPPARRADPGAVAAGVREADIVLAHAMAVRGALRDRGIASVLTRRGDTPLTLAGRARKANTARADAFVSIHANASQSTTACGFQVFHCKGSAKGERLARAAYARVAAARPAACETRWAGVFPDASPQCGNRELYVLRKTAMPAVLVELGFLTNAAERAVLLDECARAVYADAIAHGIISWLGALT